MRLRRRPSAPAKCPRRTASASSAGLGRASAQRLVRIGTRSLTVSGKGVVAPEAKRGRVFQAVSSSAATTLVQPIGVDVLEGSPPPP